MNPFLKFLKINKTKLIILAVLLSIFAQQQIVFQNEDAAIELERYVFDYRQLLDARCPTRQYTKRYTVKMGNGHGDWIGLCEMPLLGFRVTIDSDWWGRAKDSNDRRQVVYHELTHCFLGKMHVKDEHNYMYPSMNELPYDVYINQVIDDVDEWCHGD